MGVSIVLHHTRVKNLRHPFAVKLGKIRLIECAGNLNGPVTPEIKEDNCIAIFYSAHILAVKETVYTDPFDAISGGTFQDGVEMVNMTVNIPVGDHAYGNRSQVQGFPLKAGFRVKDKKGIEGPKSSSKVLIFPNNCQFGFKFWIRPEATPFS